MNFCNRVPNFLCFFFSLNFFFQSCFTFNSFCFRFDSTKLDSILVLSDIFYHDDRFGNLCFKFLVACTRLHNPLCPSVRWSVGRLRFDFLKILFLCHCSCPNGLVTSNMAPAHLHATSVAVYLALFLIMVKLRVESIK